jgi:SAM-dependent methyltransferase
MFGERLDYLMLKPLCRRVADPHAALVATIGEPHRAEALAQVQAFVASMNGGLALAGKDVLDVGCGRGLITLSFGAFEPRSVVGIDYHAPSVEQAEVYRRQWGEAGAPVEFLHQDILTWDTERRFDVVVSLAAFEHFPRPRETLLKMAGLLRDGGVIATQFGPLFHSPYGDHNSAIFRLPIPWRGVLFNHRALARLCRDFFWTNSSVDEIAAGYNRMRYSEFKAYCRETGLRVVSLRPNRTPVRRRPRVLWALVAKVSDLLGRLPWIQDLIGVVPVALLAKSARVWKGGSDPAAARLQSPRQGSAETPSNSTVGGP